MDFALPATLFSATVQTPWAGIVTQSPLVLVLTGAMWITYAAIYFLATSVFKRTPQDAAVLTLTVALPNYAALGLPILGSVLGEGASTSLSVAVSIACGSVLMTPFCLLILEREKPAPREKRFYAGDAAGADVAFGEKPIVWGPLLGVVLSAIGIKMPDLLLASIKPLGWLPPPPRCSSPG
nr:putative transporter YfdV [Klebsiella pneumoniae]